MGLPSLKSDQSIPILPVRRFWWRSSRTMITWLATKWLNHCCPILSRRQQDLDYKSKHCQHIPMQSIRSISDYRSHPAFRCLTWKSEKCWHPPATDVKCIFTNHLVRSLTAICCRRCSRGSKKSLFAPRRTLSVRRPTLVSSTFTKSSTTSRNSSTSTTRSAWEAGSLPQLLPAVPFLPY